MANGVGATSLGFNAQSSGERTTALGVNARATDGATAVGGAATATGTASIALGLTSSAQGLGSTAIGVGARADKDQGIVIGTLARATEANGIAIGYLASARGTSAVALGDSTRASLFSGVAVGLGAKADGDASIALGWNASTSTLGGIAIGAFSVEDRGPLDGYTAAQLTTPQSSAGAVSFGNANPGGQRQLINVAAGSAPTDAVNVAQLQQAISNITIGTGGGGTPTVSLVTQADPAAPITVGAITGGTSVSFNGLDGVRSLDGLADGLVAAGSSEAITGNQLAATEGRVNDLEIDNTSLTNRVVNIEGDIVSINQRITNLVNAPGADPVDLSGIESKVMSNMDAITELAGDVSSNATQITNLKTKVGDNTTNITALTSKVNTNTTNIAANTSAIEELQGRVGGGLTEITNLTTQVNQQGSQITDLSTQLTNVSNRVDGNSTQITNLSTELTQVSSRVEQNTTQITNLSDTVQEMAENALVQQDGLSAPITVGARSGGLAVDMTGTAGSRIVTGVAEGEVSETSRDAVNGSQLAATNAAVTQLGSQVSDVQVLVENTSEEVTELAEGRRGIVQTTGGAGQASVSAPNALAIGASSSASAGSALAVGNGARATGSGSVALGTGSSDGGASNVVSVGNAETQRRITNVAAGQNATDVVNVAQMQQLMQETAQFAVDYTDMRFLELGYSLRAVERDADGGTASAMAINAVPQTIEAGRGMVGLGTATWGSQQAVAVGASFATDDGKIVFKASGTYNTRSQGGASAGVGFSF